MTYFSIVTFVVFVDSSTVLGKEIPQFCFDRAFGEC